jgi:type IV secretion system protein VirD4
LVLDELPNICPLPHVDSYLSDGGGRGIQICWYAQARSQLVERFGGDKASTILGATSVMLFGGGLHDPELLKDLSLMLGQVEVRTQTRNTDRSGQNSWSEQVRQMPTMEPAEIYRLRQFEALLMTGGTGGALVRVVPWWERGDAAALRAAAEEAERRSSRADLA